METQDANSEGAMQRIIAASPLYRSHVVEGFGSENGNHYFTLPASVSMRCHNCDHIQPWKITEPAGRKVYLSGHGGPVIRNWTAFPTIRYSCRACFASALYCFRITWDKAKDEGLITKIGQYPALELEPPKIIADCMDSVDSGLYRHALTCRHSNFGIAAVAYLRRIVENRTNFLIDLIADRLKAEDPTSPMLQRAEEIKADKRFAVRIDFAVALLPKSIRIGGQNPISQLHELTSEALHGLSDDESVDVFDRCQLAFEHVIKRLKQDHDEDRSYKDGLERLSKKPSGQKQV
jgi:hypothetical protein